MTDVTVHLVAPVTDHSTDHTFGEDYPQPNLGGFTGDLTGSGGSAVLWNPTDNHSQQAGKDVFEYALDTDTSSLPSGDLVSMKMEVYAKYRANDDAVSDAMTRTGQTLDAYIPPSGPPDYDPEIWVLYNGNPGSDYTYVINSAYTAQTQVQFWLDSASGDLLGVVDILVSDTSPTLYTFDFDVGVPAAEWIDGSHTVFLRSEQPDLGTLAAISEATIYEARVVMTFDEGGGGSARSTIDSKRGGVVFVPLPPGDYTVDAVTVNDRDAQSEPSDPISVTVT